MSSHPVATATLSTRRQATFPVAACEAMHLKPGDTVVFEHRIVDGDPVWVIRAAAPDWSWFGAARAYARGKAHDMNAVRRSIVRGRRREDAPVAPTPRAATARPTAGARKRRGRRT